jgi:hypothetical protein
MDAAGGRDEHRPFEDMAVAHVLGGLDTYQGRLFRSHLLECPDCRARVGELRAIASDLAGVERDERRQRSVQSVETKQRDEAEEPRPEPSAPVGVPRWVALVLATAVVVLGSYAFLLRSSNDQLERALDDRLEASAALEHGTPLPVSFRAPGIEATARVHDDRLALLVEGLRDDTPYGVYLVDEEVGAEPRTLDGYPLTPRDGKVFVLLRLRGSEDRVVVTAPARTPAPDPRDGQRLFEARMPEGEDATAASADQPASADPVTATD